MAFQSLIKRGIVNIEKSIIYEILIILSKCLLGSERVGVLFNFGQIRSRSKNNEGIKTKFHIKFKS